MTDVWLDDRPLEEYGFACASLAGWWDPVVQRVPASPIPGRRGSRPTDRGMTSPPRRLPLLTLMDSTASALDRLTKLDTLANALQGLKEVRVNDDPERVAYATLTGGTVQVFQPQLLHPSMLPTWELVFDNPSKYDRREQMLVVLGSSGAKTVPCGSAPHRGRLWVMDTLGSRAVEVLHADGRLLYQLRLTGTLASGEYLEVDMDSDVPTITHVTGSGSVRTDVFHWLNPLDAFPLFDPQDRPRLRHNGGGDLVLFYRRAWQV